ncbi:hypothetical protein NLX83_39725 [Allokutzneria sp. A3M-2-11 16]|uniref:hypothetical protein n=1 Tax=Allokutzneria sp. A3M-2-11 16 TaxID=2962043 RepID=UPI0020B7246B|nr:hypothetical protein [Allokutzneria sp. A3M-2-11 16]MCP3805415.1 hypothetical protein [Allokutzneria sp. A3M-2-11 16]
MNAPGRGVCIACRRDRRVRADGRIFAHADPQTPGRSCPGSGELPRPVYGPLHREPRHLTAPFDAPGRSPQPYPGEGREAWRVRAAAVRRAALMQPLADVELGEFDVRIIEWLTGWEPSTVATVASWLHRAREAGRAEASARRAGR